MDLEEAVHECLRQGFASSMLGPDGRLLLVPQPKTQHDVLFFPRKKVKMHKFYTGKWKPYSWFIRERLDERSTSLEYPTSASGVGLSSGLRSAIIKQQDGSYLRLKGVAANLNRRGLGACDRHFALFDALNGMMLSLIGFEYLGSRPRFIEMNLVNDRLSLQDFMDIYEKRPLRLVLNQRNYDTLLETVGDFATVIRANLKLRVKNNADELYSFVVGFRISSDTRLDEAIWHLTRNESKQPAERDDILYNLCFRAGIAMAMLNDRGFCWSDALKETNCHIGNFVIGSTDGTVVTHITDFTNRMNNYCFAGYLPINGNHQQLFHSFVEQELHSFKEDFADRATSSMTTQLRYRNFSSELRENCYHALRTGYSSTLLYFKEKGNMVWPIPMPEKVVMPRHLMLTVDEFEDCIRKELHTNPKSSS